MAGLARVQGGAHHPNQQPYPRAVPNAPALKRIRVVKWRRAGHVRHGERQIVLERGADARDDQLDGHHPATVLEAVTRSIGIPT